MTMADPHAPRRRFLRGATCAVLLPLLALVAGCELVSPTVPSPPLVVVSDLDNMPFAGVDDDGTPIGRDVEMMEAIARHMGRPIEWKRQAFETLLPSVQAGLVDVACATLGVTPERRTKVAFSAPYFETVITVVVRVGEGEPRSWADMDGRRIAAGIGTTSERAVLRVLPRAVHVFENKQDLSSAERLLVGDVDGVAMDGPTADATIAESAGSLTQLDVPLTSERYALAVRPDDAELLEAIEAGLAATRRSGELGELDQRWAVHSADR